MPILAAVAVPHPPIILPEVGLGEEKKIKATATAYREAMAFLAAAKPEAVVLLSPHAQGYADAFQLAAGEVAIGDFARFGAPRAEVRAAYDTALADAILQKAADFGVPATMAKAEAELDHGAAIPLLFLQRVLPGVKLVLSSISGLGADEHYRFGQAIAAAAGEKPVAFIASGDLSHRLEEDGPYGFDPAGPRLDAAITRALAAGDFAALLDIDQTLAEAGAECGLRSFWVMAGALDGRAVKAEQLSYEGPFGVGYAVATFAPGEADANRHVLQKRQARALQQRLKQQENEDDWVTLARYALETHLAGGKRPRPLPGLADELYSRRAGVFVSLHKGDDLRGCIGTIAPTTQSVAEEILQNAISAACEDPRFAPVQKDELPYLSIHVDVLGEPEPIESEAELDVKKYGVIVSAGGRRGLLLPDLDGVDTVAQQVDIARQKAGIGPGEPVQLARFTVTRHV